MIGSEFLDYASKLHVATYVGVEDFADKFNFLITVMVLLLCATVVTVKQYMLKPISCYIATEVGGRNLLDYVENYCWVQGTIPISYAGNVPENDEQWAKLESQKLLYYQWVPFVLGLQCILFYIPRIIWQMICYNRTGTDLQHLINLASEAAHATSDKRAETVKHLAKSLEQLLFQRCAIKEDKDNRRRRRSQNIPAGPDETALSAPEHLSYFRRVFRYRSTFITPVYLFIKLLYLTNALGQLFLMQRFLGLGREGEPFGLQILRNIAEGRDWQMTLIFPRVAFCYAKVKNLGARDNAVTAQCALPVNMLNEKIYIFLWWWVLLAACLTLFSIFIWLSKVVGRMTNLAYVAKSLRLSRGPAMALNDKEVRYFASAFLRHDGVFMVRMIAANAGDLLAADLLRELWDDFQSRVADLQHDPLTNRLRPPPLPAKMPSAPWKSVAFEPNDEKAEKSSMGAGTGDGAGSTGGFEMQPLTVNRAGLVPYMPPQPEPTAPNRLLFNV
uniref:Innexin n=1 Tax=Schistocephalus solidus TaxID=70667 RepID=A0A0X3PLJ3_SCHSO